MDDRAGLFIDGNNWYHSLKSQSIGDLADLDYAKISRKLTGPRDWIFTRYYVGKVLQQGNVRLYSNQRRFLAGLEATDPKISVHLGRLESRKVESAAAKELVQYLRGMEVRIERRIFHDLLSIARKHHRTPVMVEKAVDVMIAVDMVVKAERDEYDAAYLLSADGNFTPAVQAVTALGKKVYVCSAGYGAQLAAAANAFIRVDAPWFRDCYR